MKKILILTAGFGEGHNSAARGIRDGLRKIAPDGAHVELHDLFAETYGAGNDWARVLYMGMINRTPAGLARDLSLARSAGEISPAISASSSR